MAIDRNFWRGKRVVVTGHTGFMGGWLSVLLKELDAIVFGYSLPATHPSFCNSVGLARLIDGELLGDIRNLDKLKTTLQTWKPEFVFHLAAQPIVRQAFRDPVYTFDVNVMGTVNVLEAARAVEGIRAILVVTSDKVYENVEWDWDYRENDRLGGREPYGVSKACAELAVEAYRRSFLSKNKIPIATARAGNVIGGGDWGTDRLIPDVVQAFSAGKPVIVRNPSATRPWQHVLEPLRGYLVLAQRMCAEPEAYAEGWNFGPEREDHKPVSWIVDECARRWGDGARWEVDRSAQPYEAKRLGVTYAKAEARLGWRPCLRIEKALGQTIDWYRAKLNGGDVLGKTLADIREVV